MSRLVMACSDSGRKLERLACRLDVAGVGARVQLESLQDADGRVDRLEGAEAVVSLARWQGWIAQGELGTGLGHGERVAQLVRDEAREARQTPTLLLLLADIAHQEHG